MDGTVAEEEPGVTQKSEVWHLTRVAAALISSIQASPAMHDAGSLAFP